MNFNWNSNRNLYRNYNTNNSRVQNAQGNFSANRNDAQIVNRRGNQENQVIITGRSNLESSKPKQYTQKNQITMDSYLIPSIPAGRISIFPNTKLELNTSSITNYTPLTTTYVLTYNYHQGTTDS